MKKRHLLKYPILLSIAFMSIFTFLWLCDLIIRNTTPNPQIDYGVTFSTTYSQELGLNSPEVYSAILRELGIKRIRLPLYWSNTENSPGQFNFSETDNFLKLAQENNVQVVLVIGYKVPRWPECFPPSWAKKLPKEQLQERILILLNQAVNHYKDRPEIVAWQVENEPLLAFGDCKILGQNFLEKEVQLVKSLDSRPVILTDSGELGLWVTALQYSDVMGTSLYRTVWNPIFGYFNYPFPPLYYRFKAYLTKAIFAPHSQGIIISELQTEPWAPGKSLAELSPQEQNKIFSLEDFKNSLDHTSRTGIQQQDLWGVEWWYYMKLHGYPEYWNFAKSLIKN